MSEYAIRIDELSKRYRIGLFEERPETLVAAIGRWFKSSVYNFRRLRKLSTFDENSEAPDIIWALKKVSFDVRHGEVVGIIGRNGAGKTTLLKILSHIAEPTSGRAILNGRVASLLAVGTGFHGELTGRENVYLNGTVLGMTKTEIDRKFDEIVAFSGVEKFIDTPVKRYSSGMNVRLAFAVAAHLEPEILLIDEVLAVGDIAFQKKCLGKMESVASEGRTVLFVSHNMQMIDMLCPRTVLLEEGRVVADGKTNAVLETYYESVRERDLSAKEALQDSRYRRGLGQVRFKNIRVRDEKGVERYRFEPGEYIAFEMTYEVLDDTEGLSVAVLLRSGKTREVLTDVEHSVTTGPLRAGQEDTIVVEFDQVPLRPGVYPLYFALASKSGRALKREADYKKRRPYDVVDDLTAPLVIASDTGERQPGFIDVASQLRLPDGVVESRS